ncbi:MAG: exodeoxyribonuclease VII large subunit, partial [Planctomycetaceae bacterium]
LIIESVVPQGVGALELAFRQLQQRLAAEGLFDPARKRPLPAFPRRIALVTSPTGAAVRDMLQVITRRWRAVDLVIVPVRVQGDGAAEEIAAGLQIAGRLPGVDLVITGRGGGSLEDLWAFNEEIVARSIAACPVPVICAVGHEIDVSIADLAADRRALTPSEAGELAVPSRADVKAALDRLRGRTTTALRERVRRARSVVDGLSARRVFTRPLQPIHDRTARLDELGRRIGRAGRGRVEQARHRLAALAAGLEALNPMKVLARGYSITTREPDGEILRDAGETAFGERLITQLHRGRITSRIETIDSNPEARPADLHLDVAPRRHGDTENAE